MNMRNNIGPSTVSRGTPDVTGILLDVSPTSTQTNVQLSVTQKRKTITHTYQLHGHTLEKVDTAKYLGITIQNNLKWDKHINTMTAKANQSLGFIKRANKRRVLC
jgi:hypothetical protein